MQNVDNNGFLNDRFDGYSAAPSDQLWGEIADGLGTDKKKKRGILWWWMGAGLAAVLVTGYFMLPLISADQNLSSSSSVESLDNELTIADQMGEKSSHQDVNQINSVEGLSPDSNQSSNNTLYNQQSDVTSKKNTTNHLSQTNESKDDVTPSNQVFQNEDVVDEKDDFVSRQPIEKHALQVSGQKSKNPSDYKQKLSDVSKTHTELVDIPAHHPELIDLAIPSVGLGIQISPIPFKKGTWEWGLGLNTWHAYGNTSDEYTLSDAEITEEIEMFSTLPDQLSARRNLGMNGYLGYHLSERVRLFTGLNLEATRYRIPEMGSGTFIAIAETAVVTSNQVRLCAVGVPIGLEFDLIDRSKFSMAIGLSYLNEMTLHERFKPIYDANYAGATVSGKNSFFDYRGAIGAHLNFNYHVNRDFRINLKPGLRNYFGAQPNTTFLLPNRQLWFGASIGFVKSF